MPEPPTFAANANQPTVTWQVVRAHASTRAEIRRTAEGSQEGRGDQNLEPHCADVGTTFLLYFPRDTSDTLPACILPEEYLLMHLSACCLRKGAWGSTKQLLYTEPATPEPDIQARDTRWYEGTSQMQHRTHACDGFNKRCSETRKQGTE